MSLIRLENDPTEEEALYRFDFGDGDWRFTSDPPSAVLQNMTWGWNQGCTNPALRAIAFPVYEGSLFFEHEGVVENGNEEGKQGNLPEIVPLTIPTDFLVYVSSKEAALDIRVGWPPRVDADVHELFERLGIVLPEGARPFNIGSRGGDVAKAKRGLGIEVTFATPKNISIIPDLRRVDKGGFSVICNTRFGLGLLLQGFPVTTVTRDQENV
jgi:hypothetical protein